MNVSVRQTVMRGAEGTAKHVSPFELFFDLVFVFAITQLSHTLLDHLTVEGVAQTALLLVVVWQAWITTAWVTNWFDPDRLPVRLMLAGVMLASLFMSVAIPEAFAERALVFGAAVAVIHVGRAAFAYVALRSERGPESPLTRTFQRTLLWHSAAGVFWVAGGLTPGAGLYVAWSVAVVMNLVAPMFGYFVPGLGSSRTGDWPVHGFHFAERCRLFMIIALGESFLATGGSYANSDATVAATTAFFVAFLGSVALWWIYFTRNEAAGRVLQGSRDPGRLARSAFTYLHLPMVAGIIAIAAADELVVAHPSDPASVESVGLMVTGAVLFLLAHAAFEQLVFGTPPWSHLVAVALLLALIPLGAVVSGVAFSSSVALILLGLAAWHSIEGRNQRSPAPRAAR
jgi:low temperature requirement protein LtrA